MRILDSGIAVIEGDSHISRWVEESGRLDHDQNSLPVILEHIKPGDWVIDAGAFIGDHTIAYIRAVGPTGRVVAFEPNPDAYACLVHNCPGCTAVRAGLSDRESFVGYAPCSNAGAGHVTREPGTLLLMAVDDSNFQRCDFIKLDVEGCELEALRGAAVTISRFRPKMWIEVNEAALARRGVTPDQLLEFVRSHNYDIICYPEERGPQYDILCLPQPTS